MTRRAPSRIEVSMFPFLSVLCSVIGVLMLFMLAIIATRAVKDQRQTAVAATLPSDGMPISADQRIDDEQYDALRLRLEQLTSKLQQRRSELAELRARITELEDFITFKEDESLDPDLRGLLPGAQLEKPDDVVFVPRKNWTRKKKPRFIEVTSNRYVVHPEQLAFPTGQLHQANSPLQKFLQQADRARGGEYLLFLLHDNGFQAYYDVQMYLASKYRHPTNRTLSRVSTGKEPFSDGWLMISQQQNVGP